MPRIRIVTDSTALFPGPTFPHRSLVTSAPMTVRCGAHSLLEEGEVTVHAAQELFSDPYRLPVAEAPTEEAFARIYARLREQADQILSIHTSSQLSKAYHRALAASQRFLGRNEIEVIDSQSIAAGLGLLVQAAAEAAARGQDLERIVRTVRGMITRLYMVFSVDNLAYLEHNGLITRSQAVLGSMLNIITFLTVEDGSIIPMEKVRTRARAIEKLIEFVSEFTAIDHIAILENEGKMADDCRTLHDRLRNLYPSTPISINQYGPSSATHVGPESLGVVVLESEEEQ